MSAKNLAIGKKHIYYLNKSNSLKINTPPKKDGFH